MATRVGGSKEGRWKGRPILAGLVRAFVFLSPMVASFSVAWGVSRALPHPTGGMNTVVWWGVVMVTSFIALLVVERLARRLTPLAVLLNLTLTFPDRAPSRYRVARQSGNVAELHARLANARDLGESGLAEAATTILSLATALSSHDRLTRGHSERVRTVSDMLADELRVPPEGKERLRWAALLHDVGKLEIPQNVLSKGRQLTAREWGLVKAHPHTGMRYLGPLTGWLGEWAMTVEQHHERFDGKGYPSGVAGNDISLGARIVAVADAYDSMTSARPYKKPMSPAAAREELSRHSGTQFDPIVVRGMMNISLGRLWRRVGALAWFAQLPYIGQLPAVVSRALQAATIGALRAAAAAATLGVAGVTAPVARGATLPTGSPVPSAHSTSSAGAKGHGKGDGPGVRPHEMPPDAAHPGHGGSDGGNDIGGSGGHGAGGPGSGGSGGGDGGGGETPPVIGPPSGGGGGETPPVIGPPSGGGNPGGGGKDGDPDTPGNGWHGENPNAGGGGNPGVGSGGGGGNPGGAVGGGKDGNLDTPGNGWHGQNPNAGGNGNGNAFGPGGNPDPGGNVNAGGNGNGNGNAFGPGGNPNAGGDANAGGNGNDVGPPSDPGEVLPPAVEVGPPGNGWGPGGNPNAGDNESDNVPAGAGASNAGGNGNGNGPDKEKTN